MPNTCLCLTLAAAALAARGPVDASIVYDVPGGITTQPNNDARWNSTVQWQNGGGTVVAPGYFLTAVHLGGNVGNSVKLTTTISGVTTTNTYTTDGAQTIAGTDLRLVHIAGAFPSASVVPLYSGAAGTEVGQGISFIGYGYHNQGTPVTSVGGTIQNGWLWAPPGYGQNGDKNFGANTVNAVNNNGQSGSSTLDYTFDPITGQNEAIYTIGDSGGGAFVLHNGHYELAGVGYAITQFYTAPNSASAINAAIYNATGLYVTDGTTFFPAPAAGITSQHGYATEVAPYASQINAIIGVPEPNSMVLALLGGTALLVGVCLRRQAGLVNQLRPVRVRKNRGENAGLDGPDV